jgi:uncharacterized membrane protein
MLVVVFDTETAAEKGVRGLRQLDAEGDISLYALGVIAKDAAGVVSVKQAADSGGSGAVTGLAVGSLIGLFGGPVGLAVGALTGTLAGALSDALTVGVGIDFVEEAGRCLQPGRVALVAEVEEDWVILVDARMEAEGGVVFRRARDDIAEARYDRDVSAFKAEITALEAEIAQSTGEAKTRLQAKIASARTRLDTTMTAASQRVEALKHEADAKLAALRAQIAKASGETRAKLEARLAQVRSAYDTRSAKLSQAWQLTRQAVTG